MLKQQGCFEAVDKVDSLILLNVKGDSHPPSQTPMRTISLAAQGFVYSLIPEAADGWVSDTATLSFQSWAGGSGLAFRCVIWNAENGADYAFSDTVFLTVTAGNPVTITAQHCHW